MKTWFFRLCSDTTLELRIVLIFHKVPITFVQPEIKTISLLLDSTYIVRVATATGLPVGKRSKREQLFPLFACLVWNSFSPEDLRNCSTLKPFVFQFRVSPLLHTCLLPKFHHKEQQLQIWVR